MSGKTTAPSISLCEAFEHRCQIVYADHPNRYCNREYWRPEADKIWWEWLHGYSEAVQRLVLDG